MPNWFYFTLNVSGKKKDVEQFVENVKGSEKFETKGYDFDFNHFIPQPENIFREPLSSEKEKELDDLGLPNWYTWNTSNWGTKWNAACDDFHMVSVDGFPYEATYDLRTAWAFPTPIIGEMIEKYKDLDFEIEGEEESGSYGVYISTSEDKYLQEEPKQVDEQNGREVYYDDGWKYKDDESLVEDQDDFWPINLYSWS